MELRELFLAEEILGSKASDRADVSGLTQNSSAVMPGSVFFALAGSKLDGHRFVEAALAKGAAAAVVEKEEIFRERPNTILVQSTHRQLGLSASRWFGRPTEKIHLVGITGTNGKTTTSYLLRHVWDQAGVTSGILGTVQYLIGREVLPADLTTPDARSLQELFHRMVTKGVTHASLEVSSIALDQWRTAGCAFEVAAFTNLTQDHLDYHGVFEDYYRAKLHLFQDYPVKRAVVNSDDPWGKRVLMEMSPATRIRFSLEDPAADFFARKVVIDRGGIRGTIQTPTGPVELSSPLIGRHNLYNLLAALACASATGMAAERVTEALASARGAPGRLERVMEGDAFPHVFVDYAHTDDALRNLLTALRDLRGEGLGRLVTVFGCGGDRDRTKRPRMGHVASTLSDVTVATSDNPRTEDPEAIVDEVEAGIVKEATEYHRVVNRRDAIRLALSLARPEDIVVIAGKGHETYQIIGDKKFPFDDREVVREYYQN